MMKEKVYGPWGIKREGGGEGESSERVRRERNKGTAEERMRGGQRRAVRSK